MKTDFLFKPQESNGAFYGWNIDALHQEAFAKAEFERAQTFYQKGIAFSEEGDIFKSWLYLGRAARLMPLEPHFAFAYALSCLSVNAPALALPRMKALKNKYDYRGAALGVVSALFQLKQFEKSAIELENVLAHFSVGKDILGLGRSIAERLGYQGIAGFSLTGEVILLGKGVVSLYLDGRLVKKLFLTGKEEKIQLPEKWRQAESLRFRGEIEGKGFLGSQIDLRAMRRSKSLVWQEKDRICAWLYYPADLSFVATPVSLQGAKKLPMEEASSVLPLFYQGLGYVRVYATSIDEDSPVAEIEDAFGKALWGSPLPILKRKGHVPALVHARSGRPGRERDFVIIMPVHGGAALVKRALQSLLKTKDLNLPEGGASEIIIVNDASAEKSLNNYLQKQSKAQVITLIENEKQQGFAKSVNLALKKADGRDVIVFNSDVVAFEDWAARLLNLLRKEKAGTATPFGNSAGQLSFPLKQDQPVSLAQAHLLDRLFAQAGENQKPIELLTGNGFCMAISAECLAKTGGIREDLFAQAYGEEVDFCLRASKHGFKHYAVPNLYLFHEGSGSIGNAGKALFLKNQQILEELYPGFSLKVWDFEQKSFLTHYRRIISERFLQKTLKNQKLVLLISHAIGGGVTRYISQRIKFLKKEKKVPLLLIPTVKGCRLGFVSEKGTLQADEAMLSFSLPEEKLIFLSFLRRLAIEEIEYHNFVGHSVFIRELADQLEIAPEIFIHDHAAFCPHITLISDEGYYCGEPDEKACQACAIKVARKHLATGQKEPDVSVSALLERSRLEIRKAKNIYLPSQDAAQRFKRHFPEAQVNILRPEDDYQLFLEGLSRKKQKRAFSAVKRIAVVGALSEWKGAFLLEELALAVAKSSLPLKFCLIGHAVNEENLEKAGVEITGYFEDTELAYLLEVGDFDAVLLPSIGAETWGYAFSSVLKAGLFTFCFDIGSVAERIRSLGDQAGFILPLGFPVERLGYFLIERLQHL
ncbi:glycosyltransferase [Acetobacteraceae bacterium]|nr:glycosyltransferase [Acetobacteraceae bacterium]